VAVVPRGRQRKRGKDALGDIEKELTLQQSLNELRKRSGQYDQAFRQATNQAITEIRRARSDQAIKWIDHAIHWEDRAVEIGKDLKHVQAKAHGVLGRVEDDVEEAA
jgi:hypothetical protein